jgi:hypothetical protein
MKQPQMESVPAGEHRVAGAIAQYPNTSSP